MNKRILTTGTAMMLLAMLLPASAYHIQGNYIPLGVATGPVPLTSGDWVLDNSLIIACESDGPNDPRNVQPVNLAGIGGLCTTGRNAVTGEDPPATMPDPGDWTRLDICSATTFDRFNAGPFFQQNDCGGLTGAGSTGTIAWSADIGVYTCFVPTTGTLIDAALTPVSDKDYALYYEELYAWWSYDLDGTEPGYHGHVSAFPDPSQRQFDPNDLAGLVLRGSAEAKAMSNTNMAPILAVVDDVSSADGDYPNNCGSSPSLTADGDQGPVIVAPNENHFVPPVPAPGLPAVVVLTDDGAGGAELLMRVNPSWSCAPVIQSGADYVVECVSSGSFDNVCVTVTVAVELASGTAQCTGGTGLSVTATPSIAGTGAGFAGPSPTATGPFRCTAHLGALVLPGWIVTCKVNSP